MFWRAWFCDAATRGKALIGAVVAAAGVGVLAVLHRRRQHTLANEEVPAALTSRELLAEVGRRSKAVLYIVSNKTNDAFSPAGLAKYLRQKGIEPQVRDIEEDALVANATLLLELLERTGDAGRPTTVTMRHQLQRAGISPDWLENLFPEMRDAYLQQPLDYGRGSRYADKWRISCYLVVMESWKPKIYPHPPMVDCMSGVMDACVDAFGAWYRKQKSLSSVDVSVMNAFVTRYKPIQDEDQLEKHIDGANVDGSAILALPTDDPFVGGALHVWDSKPQKELVYPMEPGDILFLDNAVFHQAKPISSGTRWALVLFLRLRNKVPAKAGNA